MALLTAFIWGSVNIFIRKGVLKDSSGNITYARFIMLVFGLISALIIIGFLWIYDISFVIQFIDLSIENTIFFALDGILTKGLALQLLAMAIALIGTSRAAAIRTSDAVFTSLLAYFLLGEKIYYLKLIAILLIAGGVILTYYRSEEETTKASKYSNIKIKGGLIALLSGFCFSFGNIIRGFAIKNGGGFLAGVLINYLVGAFIYFIIYLLFYKKTGVYSSNFCLSHIGKISFSYYVLAGVIDVVGSFTFFASFTLAPVWLAVTLKNTQPLIVLALVAIFLKDTEQVNRRIILSIIMVVIGTCLIIY